MGRIRNASYLFTTIYKNDRKLFAIIFFEVFILAGTRLIFVLFPKYILDQLIANDGIRQPIVIILAFVFMFFFFSTMELLSSYLRKVHSKELEFQLHTNVTRRTFDMPYEKLLDTTTYDQMYLASDIANGDNFMKLMDEVINLFSNVILLFATTTLIIRLDSMLLFITLCVVVVNVITDTKIQKRLFATRKELSNCIRRLEYVGKIAWHIDYAKEARLFEMRDFISEKYGKMNSLALAKINKDYEVESKQNFFNVIAAAVQLAVMYLLLGYKLYYGFITFGEFALYTNATNQFKDSLSGLLKNVIGIDAHSKYFEAYVEYMKDSDDEVSKKNKTGVNQEGFYFENVSYAYPGSTGNALSNVTTQIGLGERVSLVGENGAGKSTFVLLLMKLIKPSEGTIYYNGKDIQSIPETEYWKMFSTVFQDYNIYQFSVKENVALGDCKAEGERVETAMEKCGMHQELQSMINGIETCIGREFYEDGIDFSGGQKQRIALARAIYKNGKVLIMDEPTASLDAKFEYDLYSQINRISEGKTTIFISHRLYTTRNSNKILFFDGGKITEEGTHESLMELKGGYYEMYNLQSQLYEENA